MLSVATNVRAHCVLYARPIDVKHSGTAKVAWMRCTIARTMRSAIVYVLGGAVRFALTFSPPTFRRI